MEKRSGQNHLSKSNFVREGKEFSGRRAPDSKLASFKSLEATLLRGPSAKGCVMKETEMSAQALEQRQRTDNWSRYTTDNEDNRTLRVEQQSQGKAPSGSNICRPLIQKYSFNVQSREICCCSIYGGTAVAFLCYLNKRHYNPQGFLFIKCLFFEN